jgi:hypothetical protein
MDSISPSLDENSTNRLPFWERAHSSIFCASALNREITILKYLFEIKMLLTEEESFIDSNKQTEVAPNNHGIFMPLKQSN